MKLKRTKELIKKFKTSKDKNVFKELTNNLDLQKCIITNEDIIYPNTIIRLSKQNNIKLFGTSANTKKIINNKEYFLKVSYSGMVKIFGNEYSKLNISRVYNQLNKFTKFAFQVSDEDYEISKKSAFGAGVSLDVLIKRHGKDKGTKKFNEYKRKQAYSNSFEYKNKKYGWDKDKFNRFNKSRGITLDNLIKKYGKKDAIIKYENYCNKQSKTSSTKYLTNKFGIEKTNKILESKGKTIKYFENKYGDKAIEKYTEYWNNVKNPYFSKISIELFDLLIYELSLNKYKIYYKENEFGIYDSYKSQYFKYDFTIPDLNLIIEFNGDVWHGNPSIYNKNDKPHPIDKNVKANELWKYDKIKKEAAEKRGFTVIYIWEYDYINNFKKTYTTLKQNINELRIRRN